MHRSDEIVGGGERIRSRAREDEERHGGPLVEIINANDDKPLAATKQFPNGTNDWQEVMVEFNTPENCSGIVVRTARAYCGDTCPVTGTFWFDDFVLETL